MHKLMFGVLVVLSAVVLSSCETVKGAAGGTAAGMSKDVNNVRAKAKEIHPILAAQKLDAWIQQNMW